MTTGLYKTGMVLGIIILFVGAGYKPNVIGYGSFSSWEIETVSTPISDGVYSWNSFQFDSNDDVHIAYVDDYSYIHHAWKIGTTWHSGWVDEGSDVDLVMDTNDVVHIAYYKNNELWYAKRISASNWDISLVDSSSAVIGMDPSIDLDSNNKAHISYHGWTNDKLKYANNVGSGWNIETIDSSSSGGNVGRYSCIKLDNNNIPHISYWDPNNNDLCYATKSGSYWDKQILDNGHCGGFQTSIDLDSSGNPHISYYDITTVI